MYKIIELKQEDAGVVSIACEVYARVKMGQFTEAIWHCLDITLSTDEYCRRRDMAVKCLLDARTYIYIRNYMALDIHMASESSVMQIWPSMFIKSSGIQTVIQDRHSAFRNFQN